MAIAPNPSVSLQKRLWACCLWPGLPQVCLRGAFSGLILAVGFGLLLNLLLLSTLLWTELVSSTLRGGGWGALALFWLASAVGSWRWLSHQEPAARIERVGNLFHETQQHYLLGHWFEAEKGLRQILERDERDADAGLMLATLLRHTGRWDEALMRLEQLSRSDDARKWDYEMGCERRLIAEDQERADEEAAEEATVDAPAPTNGTANAPHLAEGTPAGPHPADEPAFAA